MDCWLTNEEIAAIHKIPIPQGLKKDFLKWACSLDRCYSVKLGYKVAKSAHLEFNTDKLKGSYWVSNCLWKAIWKLKVALKIVLWNFGYKRKPTEEKVRTLTMLSLL